MMFTEDDNAFEKRLLQTLISQVKFGWENKTIFEKEEYHDTLNKNLMPLRNGWTSIFGLVFQRIKTDNENIRFKKINEKLLIAPSSINAIIDSLIESKGMIEENNTENIFETAYVV